MSPRCPLALLTIAALFGSGCKDISPPPVPTTVALLEAGGTWLTSGFGVTYQLHAAVLDEHGDTLPGQPVTWSSTNTNVATVSPSGLVQTVAYGNAAITAHAGTLNSAPFALIVYQVVAVLQKVAGDAQTGTVGTQLPMAITVYAVDAYGTPVVGQTVYFVVTLGGGSVSAPSVVTAADGRAAVTWTLGATAGLQQVTARMSTNPLALPLPSGVSTWVDAEFDATAVP